MIDTTDASIVNDVAAKLVGTWKTELDNDGKPAFGLVSFSADTGVTSMQVNTRNIGLGNWRVIGDDAFEYNFHILAANDDGEYVGEAHVYVEGRFVDEGSWEGGGRATFYDPKGEALRGHSGSKVVAKKFGIDR